MTWVSPATDGTSAQPHDCRRYRIRPLTGLPTVELSVGIIDALLLRHPDEQRVPDRERFIRKYVGLLHVAAVLMTATCVSVYFIENPKLRTVVSVLSCAFSLPLLGIVMLTLNWDLFCRLLSTFDFWFLSIINAVDVGIWIAMLGDIRAMAVIPPGLCFQATLLLDANHYTRPVVIRLFLFGSPVLFVLLAAVTLRVASDVRYPTIDVLGIPVDCLDLLINGSIIIGFLTTQRVLQSRHLLTRREKASEAPSLATSRAASTAIPIRDANLHRCFMLFPVCILGTLETTDSRLQSPICFPTETSSTAVVAPTSSSIVRNHDAVSPLPEFPSPARTPLVFTGDQHREIFDADGILWPAAAAGFSSRPTPSSTTSVLRRLRPIAAYVALVLIAVPIIRNSHHDVGQPLVNQPTDTLVIAFGAAGLGISVLIVGSHIVHYQRRLIRRVGTEIDAWFVSLQATTVVLGASDVLRWDPGVVVGLGAVWLWCHWLLGLDALPPCTRRRLGLSRGLPRAVSLLLVAVPVVLVHGIYYYHLDSKYRDDGDEGLGALRNRVLVAFHVRGVDVRMEMRSFLASKLFTLTVWMGRFAWREWRRPPAALTLLKHRVAYASAVVPTAAPTAAAASSSLAAVSVLPLDGGIRT